MSVVAGPVKNKTPSATTKACPYLKGRLLYTGPALDNLEQPVSSLMTSSLSLLQTLLPILSLFFFQAEDGIRDHCVTGVQTCALPIYLERKAAAHQQRKNKCKTGQ